jgi:hypothetical protein
LRPHKIFAQANFFASPAYVRSEDAEHLCSNARAGWDAKVLMIGDSFEPARSNLIPRFGAFEAKSRLRGGPVIARRSYGGLS